jgi:hypothetical protein
MIRFTFTLATRPYTFPVPGTGALPHFLLTLGGGLLENVVDYTISGRNITIPGVSVALLTQDTIEAANGVRTTFTTLTAFRTTDAVVLKNGTPLSTTGDHPEATIVNDHTVGITTAPISGDRIQVRGYITTNFTLGSTGEFREVP